MNFTQDGKNPSKNYVGIGVVILLHIIIVYALINGLARKVVDVIQPPVETQIIKEIVPPPPEKKPEPPKMVKKSVTPPPPKVTPPPTFVPPVEVKVATPAPAAIQVSQTPPPPAPPAPPPAAPKITAPSASSMSGCSQPEYPRDSLQNEEEGTTRLALVIGPDGNVKNSKVDRSSGHSQLDRAALKALSLCHFKPGTSDGQPVESTLKMDWVWKLND
ncbi:energy transducer TonB [Aquirhabdus parva]|uniref:Energy transducer TonB n=1 Tax=Aquirhabdus parva TaxID=2283318 RepID=A0A345P3N3_9GAMM|nr:energy transducer TonB [Aquirhabdus parva]AXI01892.1 energy transducer TonB [Aquirhabdus parva]